MQTEYSEVCWRTTADGLQAMHAGVLRDMEQQRLKKERLLDFEMQRQLEQEYRKIQTVSDGAGDKRPSTQKQNS